MGAWGRVLILGAAGSTGTAFVRQLIDYRPGALHLVDVSENNLVEVVRDLRSSLLEVLRRVVPELQHEETGKNLDQKM
jgi:FlaA1/EpsC-like NDP-sugar epimerase